MKTNYQNENHNGTEAHTEQALRASELSYRRLFEAAKDGILILDVDTGRINDVNPFLTKLLGFSRPEPGQTWQRDNPFLSAKADSFQIRMANRGAVPPSSFHPAAH